MATSPASTRRGLMDAPARLAVIQSRAASFGASAPAWSWKIVIEPALSVPVLTVQ
jgi:hypothetical protein